jgi:hypothetical protein
VIEAFCALSLYLLPAIALEQGREPFPTWLVRFLSVVYSSVRLRSNPICIGRFLIIYLPSHIFHEFREFADNLPRCRVQSQHILKNLPMAVPLHS